MMSFTLPLARPCPRLRALLSRSRRGFSLIEILAVVAIIGIAALLGFKGLVGALKRQSLASASNDLRAFVQRAQIETQRRNVVGFLLVRAWNANGTPMEIILDRNSNGLPDDAAFATYTLPPDLRLSSTDATGLTQAFDAQWTNPGDGTHYLECDFQGRALITTLPPPAPPATVTAQQIAAPATVPLTHKDMISGGLGPKVVYTLSINPVWSASLTQKVGP